MGRKKKEWEAQRVELNDSIDITLNHLKLNINFYVLIFLLLGF